MPVAVPCGQCIGCRLERSRQWAIRCMHEAAEHPENAFVTLTYSAEHLPTGATLVKKDFQDFIKRLRERIEPKRLRYYHCGEYGEENSRPHYHALIFGHDFEDKILWRKQNEQNLYVSAILNEVWGKGHTSIGDVTFKSAAYVARYIMKKITGEDAQNHYQVLDGETGEVHDRLPEYTTMSRRPGIGKTWFDKYKGEVLPRDEVIVNGKRVKPPKFYDAQVSEAELEKIKARRKKQAEKHADDNTRERLRVREKVKHSQVNQLKRTI